MRRDRVQTEIVLALLAALVVIIVIIAAGRPPEPQSSPSFNSPDIVEVDVFKPP